MTAPRIREMTPADWPQVALIYAEGIATGHATFETEVPDWDSWDRDHHQQCRLIVESEGEVVAWAALSPVSQRHVYRGVAEHSIYVATEARGEGLGNLLLRALIEVSEDAGFWTLHTSIFPANEVSIDLHRRHGFRVIGTRERVGQHHGTWRDTVLMERRSSVVGR